MSQSQKNTTLDALTKNIPEDVKELAAKKQEIAKKIDFLIEKDAEDDYAFARDHIKKLLTTAEEAIEDLLMLAKDAEHPRAYEVLSTSIHQAAQLTEQLMVLLERRKKLHKKEKSENPGGSGTGTQNNFFVGSTKDLQKMIRENSVTNI